MKALVSAAVAASLSACGSSAPLQATAATPALDPAIYRQAPHPEAPAQLAQYGRLVGTWRCQAFAAREAGGWEPKARSTWTFFYALDGRAIQDVWIPDAEGGFAGTNLRLFDPATQSWTMVWASGRQAMFDTFTAQADDQRIVMHGERAARGIFGAHRARITFHDIEADRFDWRYEAADTGSDGPWQPIQRLECRRAATN